MEANIFEGYQDKSMLINKGTQYEWKKRLPQSLANMPSTNRLKGKNEMTECQTYGSKTIC